MYFLNHLTRSDGTGLTPVPVLKTLGGGGLRAFFGIYAQVIYGDLGCSGLFIFFDALEVF